MELELHPELLYIITLAVRSMRNEGIGFQASPVRIIVEWKPTDSIHVVKHGLVASNKN